MCRKLVHAIFLAIGCGAPSLAAPDVNVAWDESPQPIAGVDYSIDPPGTAYPNTELIAGSLTWRIWSVDMANEGGVGDIGYISCPHAENFGIKILTPSGGQGARDVLGMQLEPSGDHYSRIVDGHFSYLQGFLILQKTNSGTGGDVVGMLNVGAIGAGAVLSMSGTLSGHVNIGAMYLGAQATISKFAFTGSLDVGDMVDGSSLYLNNVAHSEYTSGATAHIGGMHGSALVEVGCPCGVEETPCPCRDVIPTLAVTIDAMNGESIVRYHYGPGDQSRLEIGEMTGSNRVESGLLDLGGTISLDQGIPGDSTVEVDVMSYGSVIDLNDGSISGTLRVIGACAGTIANGGDVSGVVFIPNNESVATFGKVNGQVTTGPYASGVINVTSDVGGRISAPNGLWGTIRVDGHIGATGLIEVNYNLAGLIQVGQNITAGGAVTVGGNMTGSGNVNVAGMNRGLIHIAGTMDSQSLVKVSGGMDAGSLIDVNTSGGSDSTTAGTIWIGGSATQNPLPPVTMLGTVRVNCPEQSKSFAGQVKVVGCASASHTSADICVYGTIPPPYRPIVYVNKNCAYKYGTNCTTGCGP